MSLGDLGYQDTEGYLYLSGRARDMIISGGVNIYPVEIENRLFALEGGEDCVVIGVPDPEYGEAVVAFVCGAELDSADLRARLRDVIAGYKAPREISIVPSLDRDVSGKLRKAAWQERYAAMHAEAVR